MAIRGLTHDTDGTVRVARTVTVKLAIGRPPVGPKGHPTRLDYFIFLRKELNDREVIWTDDAAMTSHYAEAAGGKPVREVWLTFLDDEPEKVFRTEYAAWMKRGKWCCGDGKAAKRREIANNSWGPLKLYDGPCENDGCPEVENGVCGPSADLYFMLNDYPALGTICRIHTSSYQSIRQISSALQDLGRITGGRLTGVSAKLFLAPDRNQYTNDDGARVTGAPKWILGLELAAADLPKLTERMLQTQVAFRQIRGRLASGPVEEDDAERAGEIVREFVPRSEAEHEKREKQLREVAVKMMRDRWSLDQDRQDYVLKQYESRMGELIERMENTTRKNQAGGEAGETAEAEQIKVGEACAGCHLLFGSEERRTTLAAGPQQTPLCYHEGCLPPITESASDPVPSGTSERDASGKVYYEEVDDEDGKGGEARFTVSSVLEDATKASAKSKGGNPFLRVNWGPGIDQSMSCFDKALFEELTSYATGSLLTVRYQTKAKFKNIIGIVQPFNPDADPLLITEKDAAFVTS